MLLCWQCHLCLEQYLVDVTKKVSSKRSVVFESRCTYSEVGVFVELFSIAAMTVINYVIYDNNLSASTDVQHVTGPMGSESCVET